MKTLIAYYSYTENNEKLAKELQRKLGCDILKIEELKKRTWFTIFLDLVFNRKPSIKTEPYSIENCDQVICIAPIWATKIASPLKTFLHAEKDRIKRYSFITICGGSNGIPKIEVQLTAILGKKPDSLAELWITDLVKGKRNTMNYKLDQRDFETFQSKINDFLSKKGMPLARGWQVEHQYGD
jgi:flavodoxin